MPSDSGIDRIAYLRMLATPVDPELRTHLGAVRQIADYDIPQKRASSFLRFHAFITSPPPGYITAWRKDENTERRWYHRHVNGILGDVRAALAASHYHADRLSEIESSVNAVLGRPEVRVCFLNSGAGSMGCSTRKMDIEYQGFVLAYRRCLDYLASALGCYFMREPNSFRAFPKTIAKTRSPNVEIALTEAHARHVGALAFVLAEGRKSVRNRIAHYEFVSAGVIHLTANGFFLTGGGEELLRPESLDELNLSKALRDRLESLHECVGDMIDTFVQAARIDQF